MRADTAFESDERGTAVSYAPLDAVLVRAPLLPVAAYRPDAPATARSEWIAAAVTVGSLSLARARPTQRAAAPRLRYGIRMATRPTPYGLFSGVGLARWGDATTLALADAPPRTRSRPDMAWLLRLVMELEARREIRRALTLRANTAALVRGGRILLTERATHAGDGAQPPRVSVRATQAARLALRLAREPVSFPVLFEAVAAAAPDVAPDRIEGLLHELLDQSLLVTNLRPPLTCASPAQWLLERLGAIPAAEDARRRLERFVRATGDWDACPAEQRTSAYRSLAAAAIDLGAKADEAPLQVDTAFALAGDGIRREIGEEVARAASLMLRLSPLPRGFPYLRNYHRAFVERYGEHREVPLLELLDPHWGLGPPDPNAHAGWIDMPERDQALLDLACGALRDRRLAVDLDEALLARLDTRQRQPGPLPASLDICAFVCARPGGVDRGEFKVVVGPNVGSPCAGRNIARFADMLGEAGRNAVRAAHRVEADAAGTLAAEIAYLPRTFRLANVALRPATCAYEIAWGVSPGVAAAHDIPLDELTVGVDEERFYLRWPGRAERVVVSSSHMLNFLEAPPVCRFLAHMHADEEAQLHVFDWGPASGFPFLPRVQAGRIVLRPAEWRIRAAAGSAAAKTPEAFRTFLAQQRAEWRLPRHVYLGGGDVRLLLDLDDPEHAEQLRREVRRLKQGAHVLLQEALPGLDDAWLPGPGGHYVVEVVVSLARARPPDRAPPRAVAAPRAAAPGRMVPPGGEWLYLKLYGSPETEEDLLTGPLCDVLEQAAAAGLPRDCFFVRYSDPDPHLRLRLRTPSSADVEAMLPELCALGRSLMDRELCSRFAVDTYEREIERYGGPALISAAENLFVADSVLVVELFRLLKGTDLPRAAVAAITALDLLDGLGLGDAPMAELASRLRPLRQESGAAYRELKASLRRLADDPGVLAREPGGADVLRHFERRRAAAGEVGRRLLRLEAERQLTAAPADICNSFLHMHCNRLLGRERAEERKALGLMFRVRQARAARRPTC